MDCDVILKMDNDVIFLNIIDDDFFYSDKDIRKSNVGDVIDYYSIENIHKNWNLYKNHKIIQYIKKVGEIFKKDLLNSLNENITDNVKEMLKYGLTSIEYNLYSDDFEKYLKNKSVI